MQPSLPVKILQNDKRNPFDDWGSDEFQKLFEEHLRSPVVLRGCDIGPCANIWTPQYLLNAGVGDKRVKIHKSGAKQLDFRKKNFVYDTVTFRELINHCSEGQEEFWYLRSLGEDPRGKDVSDLSIHFPVLFKDLKIPKVFPEELFFSSVFRITSPLLQLWTHYDTCDNILIQIRGRKRVVLFPPGDALNLYLDGDKSLVLDVDEPDLEVFPNLKKVTRYESVLKEGDILFIPALWFHNITALDFSVSVNVFWKNLGLEFYDKKDTYGNRDLLPAQLAFKTFEKATGQLKGLPEDYEDFYLKRMVVSIQKRLDALALQKKETL